MDADAGTHPIRLAVSDDTRLSRLTTLARPLLVAPHWVWLEIWGAAALPVAFVQWLFTLAAGRPAAPLHAFLGRFTRYYVHVSGYARLLANPYPHFVGDPGDYPVDLEVDAPGRQRRWTVALRLVLAVPAYVFASVLGMVALVLLLVAWLIALVLGRLPQGLRELAAFLLRYEAQTYAYVLLLTDRYPGLATPRPRGPVAIAPTPRPPASGSYV